MTREDIEKKMHESAEEIKPLVTTLVEALCEAHQKGYLAGVELGAKMAYPHWIPVEERLPKEKGKYMFRLSNGDMCYETYYPKLKLLDNVTHWMPIVPPRKEAKHDTIRENDGCC